MGLTPAAEGPPGLMVQPGADQQPQDLDGALSMVESIIFRDGGMDPNEQRVFLAWVQKIITTAQALQQQSMQQGVATPNGLGSGSAGASEPANPWSGPGGENIPGMGPGSQSNFGR
jgi:hypothetical protein